jgi:hypothetical protein
VSSHSAKSSATNYRCSGVSRRAVRAGRHVLGAATASAPGALYGRKVHWFNPSIAHQCLCTSEYVLRLASQPTWKIRGTLGQAGRLAPTLPSPARALFVVYRAPARAYPIVFGVQLPVMRQPDRVRVFRSSCVECAGSSRSGVSAYRHARSRGVS